MDNEWKELELNPENEWTIDFKRPHSAKIRYKEISPKSPTHEEIMTKWWKINYGDEWHKVTAFYPSSNEYVICESRMPFDFFLNRESADIPPKN